MNLLNYLLNGIAKLLLAPFSSFPIGGLVFWGAVSGMVMAWVFKRTSNQRALARVADHTRAELLAVRLFRDDLTVTFRCQMKLLKLIAQRLWYSLPPMLVMLVPFILILAQLALRYETYPLTAGDQAIVQLALSSEAWEQFHDISLEQSDGVTVETPGLRDESDQSITWRIRAENSDAAVLRWQIGKEEIAKSLSVADVRRVLTVVSHRRPGLGVWDRMLHPAEAAFSVESPVRQVDIFYPHARSTPWLGMDVPWWLTFSLANCVAALIVRPICKVQF